MQKVVLDIETVGLKCGFHEITEVSILNCQNLEQVTWNIKIKYPERASKEALMITNKNVKELASRGRYVEEVVPEMYEFLTGISKDPDDLCGIGHNVSFDRRFLEDAFLSVDNNKRLPINYWLCTLDMSKKFAKNVLNIKDKMSFALSNMLKVASITTPDNMHNSTVDVQATYKLYMIMKSRGMTDSEFIKLSPASLADLGSSKPKTKPIATTKTLKKNGKKIDDVSVEEVGSVMDSLIDIKDTDDSWGGDSDVESSFDSDGDDNEGDVDY